MTRPRDARFGLRSLAVVLACLLATSRGPRTPPLTATVPGLSKAERTARLEEAGGYKQESLKLANSGKLEEAVVATRKRLAIEREVLGEAPWQVVSVLGFCATG